MFGLLLLLNDEAGFQIGLFLVVGVAALVIDAARQLVDAEWVVDVVRVGANWLMVSGGHHHRQRHSLLLLLLLHHRGHRRTLVLGHVRRERRGRGQAGLRQHAGAG